MKKKLLLATMATSVLMANNTFCYKQPKDVMIKSSELQSYQNSLDTIVPQSTKDVKKTLLKNRLFAKAYLQEKGHNKKELNTLLRLAVENELATLYIKELKEKHAPTQKVVKSFYDANKNGLKEQTFVDIETYSTQNLQKADTLYLHYKKDAKGFSKAKEVKKYTHIKLQKFAPEVREWIREHKAGDISQPIQIGNYYFVEKLEKKESIKPTYDSFSPELKELLKALYIKNNIEETLEKLKIKEGLE